MQRLVDAICNGHDAKEVQARARHVLNKAHKRNVFYCTRGTTVEGLWLAGLAAPKRQHTRNTCCLSARLPSLLRTSLAKVARACGSVCMSWHMHIHHTAYRLALCSWHPAWWISNCFALVTGTIVQLHPVGPKVGHRRCVCCCC